jgi:predicted dienelactone hydrolase
MRIEKIRHQLNRPRKIRFRKLLCLGLTAFSLYGSAALASERIDVTYLFLERSISVSDLEIYSKEGRITGSLISYSRYLKKPQLQKLRQRLQARVNLTPLTVSQFLYTPVGEQLLRQVEPVVHPKSGQEGSHALRSALILAASDPDGLTALSVLQHYPTQEIALDLTKGLAIFNKIQKLVKRTHHAVTVIKNSATINTPLDKIPNGRLLEIPGRFSWTKFSWVLTDNSPQRLEYTNRSRQFPVDIYLPQMASPQPLPIIVISHGLNANRSSYAYLAKHLASHGFVVAVPEHPGSDTQQFLSLLKGNVQDLAKPLELVARPLDIKFLLDELERRNQSDPDFQGRLNFKQVGVIGQSLGAYTALVLASAPINFEQLQHDCGTKLKNTLNISLFLQCRALQLNSRKYKLSDSRIKAIVVINPFDSSIFGQASLSQIKVPIMMVAGSADTIAPALIEQIRPFSWLTVPQKYFVLVEGGTHFSTNDEIAGNGATEKTELLPKTAGIVGPDPALARSYIETLSVAFAKTYVAEQPSFRAYLTPNYISTFSRKPLPLSLTQVITPTALDK